MNLCIDWGNTNVKAAIFNNDVLQKSIHVSEENSLKQIAGLIDTYKPAKAILCSVVNENNDELTFLLKERVASFIKLDGFTRVPINNAYGTPETLGPDRLALVTAAYILHPGKNNLVVCAGTCLTYNFIQKSKTFRGGAIAPGMNMRLRAMHEFTGRLPEVSADGDLLLLGYDTETGMRSGAVNGMAAEIDGMIREYENNYADFNAILTGGDGAFFADKIKSKIFADPDLLLKGLNIIANYNV
ncbi:MAG: type III pantothenate kinase [Taibaiella sp.]|nr:type III pantothenate kinase [Taibaiella sp.]